MPWTPNDGPARHTKKASTPAKRRQWASTANAVREKTGSDAQAVRVANAAVKNHPSRKKQNGV